MNIFFDTASFRELPEKIKHPDNVVYMTSKAAKANGFKDGDIVGGFTVVIRDKF